MVLNGICFSLGLVFTRKAHEAGLSLPATSGITSLVIALVTVSYALSVQADFSVVGRLDLGHWAILLYSAIVVVFIARLLSVAAYERIGSVPTAAFSYLATVIALILPILVLGERLPLTMMIGAVVILFGVYLTERHQAKHHGHIRALHHH